MGYWKIMENGRDFDRDPEMGFRGDPELEEAYRKGCECGYKKGYRDAMKEVSGDMGFRGDRQTRSGMSGMGERYPEYPVRDMDFRDPYAEMGERRMRDSRGRYM